MPALITSLIDKQDSNEIIRNKIAVILATEEANQRALATAASKNPDLWKFAVYIERSKPWEVLTDTDGDEIGDFPLVNVSFDNDRFDNKGGSIIGMQKTTGTFYLDCYAHKTKTASLSGDEATSKEAERIARLVRNIIMYGDYSYLGLPGIVTKRYIVRREKLQPDTRQEGFENIVVCRLTLDVEYEEYTTQSAGVSMDEVFGQCKLSDSSQVLFETKFDYTT
jgi:hypothetical protein